MNFDTTEYFRSHGKAPRGRGNWAFVDAQFARRADYLDHVLWVSGSFAGAKREAQQHFKTLSGFSGVVVVCS